MSRVTDKADIKRLREGGWRLARILRTVGEAALPGVRTDELDRLAERLIRAGGDEPAFLHYLPPFADRPYPASLCVSVNDEVVHGIPSENPRVLQEGDIVGLDLGLKHEGLITDSAVTVPVGDINEEARRLIAVTKEALFAGIRAARAGSHVGDIGHAIETRAAKAGFGVVHELCGHGVGYRVHEDPQVPNFGMPGAGEELMPGMVLALEPMLNAGGGDVTLDPDGYTFRTKDGARSAHFEHTILITEKEPEILTELRE